MSDARFPDDLTLGQARARLEPLASVGVDCPCCRQHVRVYRRKLTSVAARAVAALYREHATGYGHMAAVARKHLPDVASQGGYLVLGEHWGLIEAEKTVRRDRGARSGFWRVTPLGEAWLAGETSVPLYARIYNGRCLALEGEMVGREQALGEHFDFVALMANRAPRSQGLLFQEAA